MWSWRYKDFRKYVTVRIVDIKTNEQLDEFDLVLCIYTEIKE